MDVIFLAHLTKLKYRLDSRYFCKSQAVIHAYTETFILTRYYTAAQLVPLEIFWLQRRPAYQMKY